MLLKILPVACISSFTVMTYLKKLIGTKSLNTVRQDCFLELYPLPMYPPGCIPPLTKRQQN